MNILSFDIEEWYITYKYFPNNAAYWFYNAYLNKILDMMDQYGYKGTFFCLGGMAREFPNEIMSIVKRGHNIGCHSDQHVWMNKLSETKAREDTHLAVDSLEQLIGNKVKSYRAPAFTIGESNKWMFEILAENGIEYDASVYPAVRDFGGFDAFVENGPSIIEYNGIRLKEFPICTTKLLGKDIAYCGGGYFRMLPLWFIENTMRKSDYNMTYFHIGDLVCIKNAKPISDEQFENYYKISSTWKNRKLRLFKNNIGKEHAFEKLQKLISHQKFINLPEANKLIDWNSVPVVKI